MSKAPSKAIHQRVFTLPWPSWPAARGAAAKSVGAEAGSGGEEVLRRDLPHRQGTVPPVCSPGLQGELWGPSVLSCRSWCTPGTISSSAPLCMQQGNPRQGFPWMSNSLCISCFALALGCGRRLLV